jgi:hypothetical protein
MAEYGIIICTRPQKVVKARRRKMSEQIEEMTPEGEWETISDESPTRVIFDEIGDVFIGVYLGHDLIQDPNGGDPFDYLIVRGTDNHLYSMSSGFKLTEAFKKVNVGDLVRVTYVKDVDMGVAGRNPMKDFKVDIRRPTR